MSETSASSASTSSRRGETDGKHIARRGLLFILSSPSGAGKTTLSRKLLERDDNITMSVSVTTRNRRPSETDGVDYYFTDAENFERMRADDQLLEWAKVFDNHYGTPRAPVLSAIENGRDVLFDIDWQGAQQLSQKLAQDVVRVFILPPSGEALETRLRGRAQDSEEVVAKRMAAASTELSHWPEYDYVIVNTNADESVDALLGILTAERLRRLRQIGLSDFVRNIQKTL